MASDYIRYIYKWANTSELLPTEYLLCRICQETPPSSSYNQICVYPIHALTQIMEPIVCISKTQQITVAVFFWYGTEIKIKIPYLVLRPHFSCSLCRILQDNPRGSEPIVSVAQLLSLLWQKFLTELFLQKLYFLFLKILNKKKIRRLVRSVLR